jgi:AcrR family transcriptional regulator
MSRTPGSTKAETHERIVQTAARAIREHGYAGASVADVMKQAGLTHGGFYAHFASRDAMLEEALDRAAAESRARMTAVGERVASGQALEAMIASYLSERHVEHPEAGCSLAALASETARQAPALRRIATRQVAGFAALIAGQLPGGDTPENRDRALATVAGLVGALTLARVVDDPALSRAIRQAVTRAATDGATTAGAPPAAEPAGAELADAAHRVDPADRAAPVDRGARSGHRRRRN